MFQGHEHGIIVANHSPEVAEWVASHIDAPAATVSEYNYADAVRFALKSLITVNPF